MRCLLSVLLSLCRHSAANQRRVAMHSDFAGALAALCSLQAMDALLGALEVACVPVLGIRTCACMIACAGSAVRSSCHVVGGDAVNGMQSMSSLVTIAASARRYRVHRCAGLTASQRGVLGAAAPLLDDMIATRDHDKATLSDKLRDAALALVNDADPARPILHSSPAHAVAIGGSTVEVTLASTCRWVAWGSEALSVCLRFGFSGGAREAFVNVPPSQIVSLAMLPGERPYTMEVRARRVRPCLQELSQCSAPQGMLARLTGGTQATGLDSAAAHDLLASAGMPPEIAHGSASGTLRR